MSESPRVFISYAWESEEYRLWVKRLATQLREDGVDARLDAWHLGANDSVPEFMNREIRQARWVLVLCSPDYRSKVHETEDGMRTTGVGWEARLLSGRWFAAAENKVIAALARGTWSDSAPDFLRGIRYDDLSDPQTFESCYRELLRRLTGTSEKPPPLGVLPDYLEPEPVERLRDPDLLHESAQKPQRFISRFLELMLASRLGLLFGVAILVACVAWALPRVLDPVSIMIILFSGLLSASAARISTRKGQRVEFESLGDSFRNVMSLSIGPLIVSWGWTLLVWGWALTKGFYFSGWFVGLALILMSLVVVMLSLGVVILLYLVLRLFERKMTISLSAWLIIAAFVGCTLAVPFTLEVG